MGPREEKLSVVEVERDGKTSIGDRPFECLASTPIITSIFISRIFISRIFTMLSRHPQSATPRCRSNRNVKATSRFRPISSTTTQAWPFGVVGLHMETLQLSASHRLMPPLIRYREKRSLRKFSKISRKNSKKRSQHPRGG